MHARSRRRWSLLACLALLAALTPLCTELVLPAMAHDRIAAELDALGLEGAALRVRHVGLDGVVLTDVRLDESLSIERVEATLDLRRARIDEVHVSGLSWELATGQPLEQSAVAALLGRGSGDAGRAAPRVRVSDSRVTLRHDARAWVLGVEGTLDPAGPRARLDLRSPLGVHRVDLELDESPRATTLRAVVRASDRDDRAHARVELPREEGAIRVEARAQWAEGERWPGTHVGAGHAELTAAIAEGALTELRLSAEVDGIGAEDGLVQHVGVEAAQEGGGVAWSLRARTPAGLEARGAGALPLELARWPEGLRSVGWALEGPFPAAWIERELRDVVVPRDPQVALRGTARLEPSGAWSIGAMAGIVELPELLVPSAGTRVLGLRVEGTASARVEGGVVEVELAPGTRYAARRARLEEVHARSLSGEASLIVRVDPSGAVVRARGPIALHAGRFEIGEGAAALRFEDVDFSLRERRARPLADGRGQRLRVRFGLRARARAVGGVLRGARAEASGTLDVDVGAEGTRIALPLEVTAGTLEQRDSEASLADARVTLPLRWSGGALRAQGAMSAGALAWRGTPVGPARGAVTIERRALRLAWSAPATDTTAFRLDATLALDGSGRGRVDVALPASVARDGDPVQRVLAALTDMKVEGAVEGEVHVDLGKPERGHARLTLREVDLEEVSGAGRGRGVRGTLLFTRLEPLLGAADAPVTWTELELGDVVRLGPGSAAMSFVRAARGEGSEVEIASMEAAALGGRVRLEPFRMDWAAPVLDLGVAVEGVHLGRLLRALTDRRASATGEVDGRVALRVRLGERRRVELGPGRLSARRPGRIRIGRGTLEALDEARLSTLVEGEWIERRVLAALADFEYRRLVVELDEVAGTRRLRAHVLGRGLRVAQELDLTLNVRGIQPLLDQALRLWPTGAAESLMEVRQQ